MKYRPSYFWQSFVSLKLLDDIIRKCFVCLLRYGSPGNTTKEYTEFAEHFLKGYAVAAQQVGSENWIKYITSDVSLNPFGVEILLPAYLHRCC